MKKVKPLKDWELYDGEYLQKLEKGVACEVPQKFIASLIIEGVINLEQKILKDLEKK